MPRVQIFMNWLLILSSLGIFGLTAITSWSTLTHDGKGKRQEAISPSVVSTTTGVDEYQLSRIFDARLFGLAEKKRTAVAQRIVPKTRLSIKLHGVAGSANPRLARSLISVGGAAPESFGIGESIPDTDALIYNIDSNRVLLDRGGNIESLELDRKNMPWSLSN